MVCGAPWLLVLLPPGQGGALALRSPGEETTDEVSAHLNNVLRESMLLTPIQ